MQMEQAILTSNGRDAEQVAVNTQAAIREGGAEFFARLTTVQQYRATNPFAPDDTEQQATGDVLELVRQGAPIGPAMILVALGLEVGESLTAGPVKIERLPDLAVN